MKLKKPSDIAELFSLIITFLKQIFKNQREKDKYPRPKINLKPSNQVINLYICIIGFIY